MVAPIPRRVQNVTSPGAFSFRNQRHLFAIIGSQRFSASLVVLGVLIPPTRVVFGLSGPPRRSQAPLCS
ncbi:unnamed protein product [Boreogadus saida]